MVVANFGRRPRQRGMNLIDYLLLGVGITCTVVALGDFRIAGNDLIFLGVAALAFYFALDGVKAEVRDLEAIVLLLVMGIILFANLEPYAAGAKFLFGDKLPAKIIEMIPFVGGLWPYVVGGLLMAPIIYFEVKPTTIEMNRKSLERTIAILEQQQVSSPDNPNISVELARLQQKLNNFALDTYKIFKKARLAAYIVDFVAIEIYYPPIKGGWSTLRWGWPTIDDYDLKNIAIALAILFLLQILVMGFLWNRNVNEIFVKGVNP